MTTAAELISTPKGDNEPADPFSSDLFGSNEIPRPSDLPIDFVDPAKPPAEQDVHPAGSWMSRLPRVSRTLVESSPGNESLPEQLPELFSTAIGDALGEIILAGSGSVSCKLESMAECDLFAESTSPSRAGTLAIRLVFEPTQSNALVIVGSGFVRRMIDKIFGSSGYESSNRISPIEIAMSEFLAAKVVARLNDGMKNEFFSVGDASLMPTELFGEHEAGAKGTHRRSD